MTISSPVFLNNENIPEKYTCDGENINPPLSIGDVPADAATLALIVFDPDVEGGGFTHWVVWNINPELAEIDEDSVPPESAQGITDFETRGYGGPCPPSGTHRYFFTVYALDTVLELSPNSTKDDLEQAMIGNVLEKAELAGLYSRNTVV